ncbi:hypothetical protein LTR95_017168 [Oleoguttula sp. CCFEE 5521]
MVFHSCPAQSSTDHIRDCTIAEMLADLKEQDTDEGFEEYLRHTAKRGQKYIPLKPYDRKETLSIFAGVMANGVEVGVNDVRRDSGVGGIGQALKMKTSESELGSKRLREEGPIEDPKEDAPTNEAKVDDSKFIALMEREVIDLTTDEPANDAIPASGSEPVDLTDEDEDVYNVTPEFAQPTFPSVIPHITLPAPQIPTIPETPASRPKKTPTPRPKKWWMGPSTQLDVQMDVKVAPAPTPAPEPPLEKDLLDIDPDLIAELEAALQEPEEGAAAVSTTTEVVNVVEAVVMAGVITSQQEPQKQSRKKKSNGISAEMQAHIDSAAKNQA